MHRKASAFLPVIWKIGVAECAAGVCVCACVTAMAAFKKPALVEHLLQSYLR